MFDLGSWGEFLIIMVAVLVLIGPKELPMLLRAVGKWSDKAHQATKVFRQNIHDLMHEGEIEAYIQETNDLVRGDKAKSPKKSVKSRHSEKTPPISHE